MASRRAYPPLCLLLWPRTFFSSGAVYGNDRPTVLRFMDDADDAGRIHGDATVQGCFKAISSRRELPVRSQPSDVVCRIYTILAHAQALLCTWLNVPVGLLPNHPVTLRGTLLKGVVGSNRRTYYRIILTSTLSLQRKNSAVRAIELLALNVAGSCVLRREHSARATLWSWVRVVAAALVTNIVNVSPRREDNRLIIRRSRFGIVYGYISAGLRKFVLCTGPGCQRLRDIEQRFLGQLLIPKNEQKRAQTVAGRYMPLGSHGEEAVHAELEHAEVTPGLGPPFVDPPLVLQRQVEQHDPVHGHQDLSGTYAYMIFVTLTISCC